jgi:hypothetical protein
MCLDYTARDSRIVFWIKLRTVYFQNNKVRQTSNFFFHLIVFDYKLPLMKFIYVLAIFCLSCISQANAFQCFSTSDFNEIELLVKEADQDTLVLWDVDQTLLTPNDPILKPKWEKLLDQWLGGKKFIFDRSGKKRYIFREILMSAPHSVLDHDSPSLIKNLQKKQIPVIAFSAAVGGKIGKTDSFIDWRIEELKRFDFDFSSSFSHIDTLTLPKDSYNEFPPIYKSGVLLTSLHDKGPVLIDFFEAIQWTPKKVIFIDDQMANIESVAQSLGEEIEVIGIYYTAASELPCELNEEKAHFQVEHFLKTGQWLPSVE